MYLYIYKTHSKRWCFRFTARSVDFCGVYILYEDTHIRKAPMVRRTEQRESFQKAAKLDREKKGPNKAQNGSGRGRGGRGAARGTGARGRGRGGRGRGRGTCDAEDPDQALEPSVDSVEKPKKKRKAPSPANSEAEDENGTVRYSQESLPKQQKAEETPRSKPAKQDKSAKPSKGSPKSNAKAKASPKSTAKVKASPKSKQAANSKVTAAKKDAEEGEDEPVANRRKTFAGRRMPTKEGAALDRYLAMEHAFHKIVFEQLNSPSTWEVGTLWG